MTQLSHYIKNTIPMEDAERDGEAQLIRTDFAIFSTLIKDVQNYVDKVGECYENAEHNRRVCRVLYKRVNNALSEVKNLRPLKDDFSWFFENSRNYQIFQGFAIIIKKIRDFIIDISQLHSVVKYFNEYRSPEFSMDKKFYSLIQEFEKSTKALTHASKGHLYFARPEIDQNIEEAISLDIRDMENLFDLSEKILPLPAAQQPAILTVPTPRIFFVQTVQDAINMHKSKDGDHKLAYQIFCYYADLGDYTAKYWGVEKHEAEAVKYFERSANNGNTTAMYNIGNMYYNGYGVIRNIEKGAYYLRLTALKGQLKAIDMCKRCQISL
ncbi:13935_t:CDS:2 [Ambispora leptoticha]|uniref:13935_t:CDS:1 n=1 Tax=Ambispora leptoticha TaxID=144679 RepID=A0A9N9CS36_9GLOM|nr:13935_t:CDS:2 [Ambispora leptoticha]